MRQLVYVASNEPGPGANRVLVFRDDEGSVSFMESFPTGGSGAATAGGPFDADDYDGNVVIDDERRLLFVANGGSDSIAVFHVSPEGGLVPVEDSPFPSGGPQPVSIGLAGDRVVVANKDRDPGRAPNGSLPGYTSFRIRAGEALEPVEGSTITAPKGASPTQALVAGDLVFGADIRAAVLRSFRLGMDGSLEEADSATVADGPPGPIGLAVHPDHPLLYAGLPAANRIGVYAVDDKGFLQAVTTSGSSGRATCWLVVNRAGTFLYAANNADNSLSVFDLSDAAAPVERQHLPLQGGSAAYQIALDGGDEVLYAVSTSAASGRKEDNVLHRLEVQPDGTLRETVPATTLPVAGSAHPAGVAVLRPSA